MPTLTDQDLVAALPPLGTELLPSPANGATWQLAIDPTFPAGRPDPFTYPHSELQFRTRASNGKCVFSTNPWFNPELNVAQGNYGIKVTGTAPKIDGTLEVAIVHLIPGKIAEAREFFAHLQACDQTYNKAPYHYRPDVAVTKGDTLVRTVNLLPANPGAGLKLGRIAYAVSANYYIRVDLGPLSSSARGPSSADLKLFAAICAVLAQRFDTRLGTHLSTVW